jgi:GrpB-like predicted nucleotidyltransferase (UPF0157 family)
MNQKRIIEIVDYNDSWSKDFVSEKERIKDILKDEKIKIHHIGSTSVPGMPAKPTIDIMIEIDDVGKIDTYNKHFEKMGYIALGEYGIEGKRYFYKEEKGQHTYHIHIFQNNCDNAKRHLAFKKLLIENENIKNEYAELKIKGSKKYTESPEKYREYKNNFIKEKENIAMKLYYA